MSNAKKIKPIPMYVILKACDWYCIGKTSLDNCEFIMKYCNVSYKEALRAMEKAERKGLIDYSHTLDLGILTEKGEKYLKDYEDDI